MVSGPAMAPSAWPGAGSAAAATQDEMRWRQLDSGVSAVSFGFVATAILVSMFLAMAILEHFLRAPARARGMDMGPPRGGILFRLRFLLLRRGAGGGAAGFPGLDLETARKLDGRASPEMNSNYRRRSENEDEFLFLILPEVEGSSSSQSSQKKPIHTSIFTGASYIHETLTGHEVLSQRRLHMEREIFQALVQKLREKCKLEDGTYISVEEQVGMFLYTISKNASNRTVQDRFEHSGSTVSYYFQVVLSAITSLTCNYIRMPSLQPHRILRQRKFSYFQNCIGAIDGTHIPMTILDGQQEPYRNRKQGLSQNVMVACDFDLKFVRVHHGWEGSASDARVLQDALKHGFSVPPGKFYLVDAGYGNTPQFLAPYRGTRYHLQEQGRAQQKPQSYQELFNLRHAQLRNHVERIIGILKKRYSILKAATSYDINTQVDISMACCVMHNFIRLHNGDMTLPERCNEDINESNMVVVPDGDTQYNVDVPAFNSMRQAGNAMRDAMAKAMWADYIARR